MRVYVSLQVHAHYTFQIEWHIFFHINKKNKTQTIPVFINSIVHIEAYGTNKYIYHIIIHFNFALFFSICFKNLFIHYLNF